MGALMSILAKYMGAGEFNSSLNNPDIKYFTLFNNDCINNIVSLGWFIQNCDTDTTMQQPWIDAYSDPKADIQTFSSCLALADLNADGDFKLILADFGNGTNTKLKVFKGTSMSVELPLISPPSAITTLYTEKGEPHIPDIVVASGSSVLVYRNCRPYFKFSLPAQDCSSLEADLWQQKSQTNYNQLVQLLQELSIELGFSNLSPSSQKLLSIEPHLREDFLNKCNVSLQKQMVITCVATINKNIPDEKDVSCLLLGTESGQLYVMDPETFTLINSFLLTGIPYIICATGVYLIEYRIIFTCRNGSIYLLKSGNIRYICQLSSLPVSMVLVSRNIVITSMDCTLQSISMKGRKQWSVSLPGNVTCMTAMPLTGLALNLIAVALDNGAVHLYNGAQLCYAFNMSDHISSMIFGQYGREEHALVSISSSGAIGIKLLKRTAQFKNDRMDSTNDIHHGIKLLIPKKSKLIVEQTLRERQQCKEMHSWFQRSWLDLSVVSSEAYLNALRNATVSQKESLKLTVQVIGLGPRMKLQMTLESMSYSVIPKGLGVSFIYDPKIYTLQSNYIPVPMLVPGFPCKLESLVLCHMPISSQVQVIIFSTLIHLSAIINMPASAGVFNQI